MARLNLGLQPVRGFLWPGKQGRVAITGEAGTIEEGTIRFPRERARLRERLDEVMRCSCAP
jgi:hypothetical protein